MREKVTSLSVASEQRKLTLEQAWAAYVDAAAKAWSTMSIADGIAAGQAWRAWLELFEPR